MVNVVGDAMELQRDLGKLCEWADRWSMAFNADKCSVLTVTKKQRPLHFDYQIKGTSLEHVQHHPYLGVEFAGDLSWGPHLGKMIPKAQRTLNLLRRNLYGCSRGTKDMAYRTMVRPVLEYAACAWDPYHAKDINRLEAVQKKAARFVTGQHQRDVSVTLLQQQLQWRSLQERRLIARLAMFHKIQNGQAICDIPPQYQRCNSSSRESHPLQYTIPPTRVDSYLYSYFPRTTRLWNFPTAGSSAGRGYKSILQQSFDAGAMYVVPPKGRENRLRLGSTSRVVEVGPVY